MKKRKAVISRSENMSRIKSNNTSIEKMLGKAMWSASLRYRKQCKDIFGKPDFCFKGKKIAIFCDSEFWHGKKFLEGEKFKTNTDFWETKIKRNIERDKQVNKVLQTEGWCVIRFWGRDIQKNIDNCLAIIFEKFNT
ncbi:MAG: very short patch repair endonuclease [Sulfuricurvum sp.]|uniref:very short patch repair endonuclease n=1 Tax=Sulfuricurvum sp. TaxID=2025608 RepID=UPI0027322CD5|nr:very short patch repair endonuclease [Sulfuricurvum sp.]MDP3291323.1 very short patch repair endonuclease [Sulfuricurvum sp.]